jgi:lysophospholipase L1-like esterase
MNNKTFVISSLVLNFLLACMLGLLVFRLGGVEYMLFKVFIGDDATGVSQGRKEHLQILDAHTGGVVMLGNSITQQTEWSELLEDKRVKNRGIGGDTVDRMTDRLGSIIASDPEKLFFMGGINDLVNNSPDLVLAKLIKIITMIHEQSPNTQLYVQSILPVNNSVRETGRSNDDIRAVNRKLKIYSEGLPGVQWVDLYPHYVTAEGNLNPRFTHDGLHLGGDAYLVWRNLIAKYM